MDVKTAKKLSRENVWKELETQGIARFPLPCFGRIPNFVGSDNAAEKVRHLKEWRQARVVFAGPDFAQHKVRQYSLQDGKILVMASPKLKYGYVVVNSADVKGSEDFASTIRGAFKYGKIVSAQGIPKPDLIIEGSVAVDTQGNRLGKGGGYGDLEIRTLQGIFGPIPVVSTVHDIQVVQAVPFEEKDERVSIIVTPTRIVRI